MKITVTSEVLILKSEIKQEEESEDNAYHIREQRLSAFERTILLPTDVVSDKVKAEFDNGILAISLPKVEEVKPKLITVKVK